MTTKEKTQLLDLQIVNRELAQAKSEELIQWGMENFGDRLVMTTSFGIQAAVMLHLVTKIVPNIPVIWEDSPYQPKLR
ncbi:MAG: phosphoadenosine phosphosulfate reductase family protein, partial [Cyanobacteria bacterium J06642_3]